MKLKDISRKIIFDEVSHTYTRAKDGKQLTGVTSMLRMMGLSADYTGVGGDILAKAADRGKLIHALCDRVDETDSEVSEFDELEVYHELRDKGIITLLEEPTGTREANSYLSLRRDNELLPVTSEYLVSDGEHIASSVDLVLTTKEFLKQNKVILADIKCTSSIHKEPLGWQLSIYKYLFEKQNPKIKVVALLGVWLPKENYGRADIFNSKEFSTDDVTRLLDSYISGQEFDNDTLTTQNSYPLAPTKGLAELLRTIEELKKREEDIRASVTEWMVNNKIRTLSQDGVEITYCDGILSNRFDTTKFKKDYPELYAQYTTQTMRKESIRMKLIDKQ